MQSSRGLFAGFLVVLAAAVGAGFAGCGPGSNAPAVGLSTAGATPPSIPSTAPTTSIQSIALSTPASGTQIPVPIPTVAGYAGTIGLAIPASLPANANLAETASNAAIDAGSIPTLQSTLRAAESTRTTSATSLAGLFYLKLASSGTIAFPNQPAITLTVPAGSIVAGTAYYLGAYDPLRPSLGWQRGWEGPATISGTTLTFAAPSLAVAFTCYGQIPIYFALYAVSTSVTAPTPAPSISPAPTPAPLPAFTLSSTSLALLGVGATATATATIADTSGYAGAYAAGSSASSVATAAVSGSTVTVTAVAAGSATIAVTDTNGRTVDISVVVTPTNVTIQGGRP